MRISAARKAALRATRIDMSEETSNRDEELQERKRELEEELERYAQAGIASPNVVKAARWVSRGLYFLMAALVMYLLVSGWGSVSKEQHMKALKAANDAREQRDEIKAQRDEFASQYLSERATSHVLRSELESMRAPDREASRAMHDARILVERLYGERAYAAHWRERAESAEPGAHGGEPVAAVKNLLRQAATAHSAVRFEVLRLAGADFGLAACRQAALDLLNADDADVRAVAALIYARAQAEDAAEVLAARAEQETDADTRREIWLAWATRSDDAPQTDVWYPEAWAGYCVRTFDPSLHELVSRYAGAPDERRLELLALIATTGGGQHADAMSEIAVSASRPDAERIIAVRWFADRKEEGGLPLLERLSEGEGPLAKEAAIALQRMGRVNRQTPG